MLTGAGRAIESESRRTRGQVAIQLAGHRTDGPPTGNVWLQYLSRRATFLLRFLRGDWSVVGPI